MFAIPTWLNRALDVFTQTALVIAAGACAMCAVLPWGTATLFRDVTLHIPGAVYQDGMIVLAAATTAAFLRRSRIAGIIAALICLHAAQKAAISVPSQIIYDLAGAQINLFPINRVLDQAHIPDLTIGNWSLKPESYLDYGLAYTTLAAKYLLAASIAGILYDPLIAGAWQRFGAWPCRRCRMWIAVRSHAEYCTRCGLWLPRRAEPRRCRACRQPLGMKDNFCAACGLAAAEPPAAALTT